MKKLANESDQVKEESPNRMRESQLDMNQILDCLREALVDCDTEKVVKISKEILCTQIDPFRAVEKLTEGIRILGGKFERGEVFLCELIVAAEIMKEAVAILETVVPKGKSQKYIGKILIGTVEGDLHDIGKNIVAIMLSASGFQVYDLGVDVSTSTFIEKVREAKPDMLAMSALLTTTMPKIKEVIEALKKLNLRDKVQVMIGGSPVSEEWAEEIGADGYAADMVSAVAVAKKLLKA